MLWIKQHMVGAPSINAFKVNPDTWRQTRMGFFWINPLRPRPSRMTGSPLRPQKVR